MAMYHRLGPGRYRATEHTQGPWDPGSQHMGPVTALIAHELERTPGLPLSRLAVDVFSPVPVGELTVTTEMLRDGKRVQCLSATVADGERTYARATAWRIREADTPGTAVRQAPEIPDKAADTWLSTGFGYGRAIDWRFVRGAAFQVGPATAWGRVRVPLVEGEEITPLERLALFADSGNGISPALPFEDYLFVNVDLVISLFRTPVGEWICMESETIAGASGRGLTRSTLFDVNGEVGSATQTLFVAPR